MTMPTRMLICLLATAPAFAGDDEAWAVRAPDLASSMRKQPEPPATPAEATTIDDKPHRPAFGDARSRWWTIGGGAAFDFSEATDLNVFGDFTYFVSKNVEFTVELGGWYFNQQGPDAFGINPEMILRWHFYNEGRFTFFGDVGIGLLFCSDNVPDGGTTYNFLPRIGGGMTYALTEDLGGSRLQLGFRWHHISNGRSNGDADNPSRDGLMLYTGIVFPY